MSPRLRHATAKVSAAHVVGIVSRLASSAGKLPDVSEVSREQRSVLGTLIRWIYVDETGTHASYMSSRRDSFRRRGWNLPVPRAGRLSVTSTNYPTHGSIRLFEDGITGPRFTEYREIAAKTERTLRHKLKLVRQMSADRLRRVRSESGCLQLKSGGSPTFPSDW